MVTRGGHGSSQHAGQPDTSPLKARPNRCPLRGSGPTTVKKFYFWYESAYMAGGPRSVFPFLRFLVYHCQKKINIRHGSGPWTKSENFARPTIHELGPGPTRRCRNPQANPVNRLGPCPSLVATIIRKESQFTRMRRFHLKII